VPVIGYGTHEFPAFWLHSSGIELDWRLDTPEEFAAVLHAQDADEPRGLIVANPISTELQWDPAEHDRVLAESFAAAEAAGVRGKAVTPFLLGDIVERSGGRSLEVNLDLVRSNIRLASEIAVAYAGR
jgi:pseudouridine-5'-phosphate glycosidase